MNESQEATLVLRCQAGDNEAFCTLVEQYRSVLFGTAYLMIRDSGLAEDAVQNAVIQIWRHLPSLRLQGSLKAWLARIVINEVKHQFRRKQAPTVPLEQATEVANKLDEAETAMIHVEERQRLRQAMEMLPREQRKALVLRYFSGLTIPEIAAVIDQREGKIKSRLSRALDLLGGILRGDKMWEGGCDINGGRKIVYCSPLRHRLN